MQISQLHLHSPLSLRTDKAMDAEKIYDELVELIATVDDFMAADIKAAQLLKQSVMPKSIFKYRLGRYDESGNCWDVGNLRNNQVRMTLPESFNDPYDSLFSVAIRGNELERKILDHMIFAPIRKSMRICCFSESIESMLMWTHYANEHKGFAIEYGPNEKSSIALQLWPVFYRDKLFDLSRYFSRISSSLIPLLPALHKAIDWKYEKEWRLIVPGNGEESLSMPSPKALYLGSKCCPKIEEEITAIAIEKKIKLFRMSHNPLEFKMDITLVPN